MLRPISTLPLPTTAQILLRENGFMFCEDVVSHRGVVPEARHILQRWNLHSNECWRALIRPPSSSNCLTLWQGEIHSPRIVTWSREVDAMLGGGIKLASITELCGAPGSGKTQISLQLCVTVQIPEVLGGVDGEALYIDTSSNFTPQRVREMADACSKHCSLLWEISCRNQGQKQKEFSTDKIMNGIHVVSVHGITPLLAAVKVLPQVLVQHPKIKLIIIDSLAFSFHCGEYCDTINRTSFIYRIMSDLQQLCVQKQIAIVVTNHLTTRLIGITGSEVLPALGESMGHRVNQRLILGHLCDNTKVAISLKGNNQCSASAKLRITQAGVRDI